MWGPHSEVLSKTMVWYIGVWNIWGTVYHFCFAALCLFYFRYLVFYLYRSRFAYLHNKLDYRIPKCPLLIDFVFRRPIMKEKKKVWFRFFPSTSFKIITQGLQVWSYFQQFSELKIKYRKNWRKEKWFKQSNKIAL